MIRISDIAKDMNLSEATVSNAFTGKGRMKPETRDAIIARAGEMGYQVRPRKTSGKKRHLISIAENLNNPFVTSILSGIFEEVHSLGFFIPAYSLRISDTPRLRNPDISQLNLQITDFLSKLDLEVSGILYIAQYARRMDGLLNELTIPSVSVFCSREDGKPFIHYDDQQGAYLAVSSLLEKGCRKIAMISGPIESIGMYLRSSGYQQALMEHHLPYDPRLVRIGDWDEQSGYQLTSQLLSEGLAFDAIFAQNDFIGLGAIRAVQEKGFRVPQDIFVIGFDNYLPSRLSDPPLTSIKPPFEEMGRTALHRLLQQLGEEKQTADSTDTLLPCELIQRESTNLKDS